MAAVAAGLGKGMVRRIGILALALLGFLILPSEALHARDRLLVFAAVSLQDVLGEIADNYEANGAARPVLSFAASSTLARQIEHGAPAALFISADEEWMDYLEARGKIEKSSRRTLVGNRLAFVTPAGKPRKLEISSTLDLTSFLGGGRLAMGDPQSVPVGRYGRAALRHYGLWDGVARQVIRADNARSALAFVARGEVAAAIVYRTDALAEKAVAIAAEFPVESHPPIRYPVALTRGAGDDARAFLEYLGSNSARRSFARFGFTLS